MHYVVLHNGYYVMDGVMLCNVVKCKLKIDNCDWLWENLPCSHKINYLEIYNSII